MDPFSNLPEEMVQLIFQCTASTLGLRRIMRLRVVSKLFDAQIRDAIIYSGVIEDYEIVKCPEKDLILKYLHWRMGNRPSIRINNSNQTMADVRAAAKHFVCTSGNKYTLETALDACLSLLADELILQQAMIHKGLHPDTFSRHMFPPSLCWWGPAKVSLENICLSLASALGDETLLLGLIENKETFEVRAYGTFLGTPLEAAIRNDQEQIIDLLLSHVSNKDPKWNSNHRELLQATLSGNLKILERFLDIGIATSVLNDGRCVSSPRGGSIFEAALVAACHKDKLPLLEKLLEKAPIPRPYPQWFQDSLLLWACQGPSLEIARYMFAENPQLSPNFERDWWRETLKIYYGKRQTTPLQEAARHGDLALVRLLLHHGAEARQATSRGKSTAVSGAARGGNNQCIRALFDAGAGPLSEEDEITPLFGAVLHGHASTVKLLLENGYGTSTLSSRAQLNSLSEAHVEGVRCVIDMLIETGIDAEKALDEARTYMGNRRHNSVAKAPALFLD